MEDQSSAEVIALQGAQDALRRHFLGWQCRLRQLSVREDGGRPNAGMRPSVRFGENQSAEVIVLINYADPYDVTEEFRHMVRRTQDPQERYKAALKLLSAHYYQYPEAFSDHLTALFSADSGLAETLLAAGNCHFEFDHFNQRFQLPCEVRELSSAQPAHKATYWHNALFNPSLPGEVKVLAFVPDWATARADPPTP